jgi:hypothetical protein
MDDLHFKLKQESQSIILVGSNRFSALAAIGMGVASLAIGAAPASAFQTTVDFSSTPRVSNQASLNFNGGFGVQASFSNARTRTLNLTKTIDSNDNGICIGKSGPAISECGRSTAASGTNAFLGQGSIDLTFNQQLSLQGFRVGQNSMNQYSGGAALNFLLNGVEFATFSYGSIPAGNTLYKFPGSVYYNPGDVISIVNTGFNINPFQATRTFYLKSFDVGSPVPAPLPVLATATAFGWSRRLRSRVRRAAAAAQV